MGASVAQLPLVIEMEMECGGGGPKQNRRNLGHARLVG